jgi:GTPase SAR1 family protein
LLPLDVLTLKIVTNSTKMKDINNCHKDFLDYKGEFENLKTCSLTESDTRSKIIDRFFINVLDWDEDSIKREGYVVEGYYDYLLGVPGFQFIVEAKKNLIDFIIPTNHKTVTIGTFEKSNKDVVSQIRKYLFEVGLQYAVITNGHQFIIGKFSNTDGSDWRHNKCLIFNGFDDINDRFIVFYNILSKNSICENSGFKIYLEESIQREGKTILSTLPAKDSELVRNPLSSELTPLINQLFGELYNIDDSINKELISECFIENKEIKKNRSEIEKLFADTPPPIDRVIKARNTESIVSQITEEILQDDLRFNENPPNPIVIVGSKGAGKTTFINYLFNKSEDIEKSHPYIYIDFRKYTGIKDSFEKSIYYDILEQVYEKYNEIELSTHKALCSIYNKEIRRNNEGIWKYDFENNKDTYHAKLNSFLEERINDSESHFFKLSEHLIKSRRTRLCVVIDNADQFDFKIQKDVFLFAQSLNKKGNVTIIISLREGYYYKWRYLPPFDAFPSNVYHITAPPYKEVLQKRISYALGKIQLEGKSKGAIGDNKTVILSNDSVRKFLMSLESTLFGEENSELLNFIQETTYPNIRDGLEIFKHFLISGHTEVHEYILRQETNPIGTKIIPYWEFIKAVGLYNKKYYNHNISIINNLFYPVEGSKNHFLKIKILKVLDSKLISEGNSEKYFNVEELIKIFVNAGYIYKYVKKEIEDLSKYRLIETDEQLSDIEDLGVIDSGDSICISLKGHHYINTLMNNFSYIEMTLEDTPIYDEEFFNKIKNAFPFSDESGKRNLKGRVAVAQLFIEYLAKEERLETVESEFLAKNIVSTIKMGCLRDISRINRKLSDYNID